MSDDEISAGPASYVRQPLPPEVPVQRTDEMDFAAPVEDDSPAGGPDPDWWRTIPATPPGAPPRPDAPPAPVSGAGESGGGDPGPGRDWWNGDAVREELRDTWATHGSEGIQAATEIGAYIGDAIASHLPNPHAVAERRGLDIRWLRLKYNVPAVLISLLVTWRGQTSTGHLSHAIASGGIFGLVGAAMAFVLPLLFLAVLPIRTVAVAILGTLSAWILRGLTKVFGWAWKTPGAGYLLRLALAVAIWSTALLVLQSVGRGLIRILTGA
ncbi:hypothetical protein [Streptomyces sp. NPDC013489]|uniref:hypothetical protein n=1 Tax=Streptomyces sp. NPDC013489 TaxID=3155606 RepID=UPI00340AA81B